MYGVKNRVQTLRQLCHVLYAEWLTPISAEWQHNLAAHTQTLLQLTLHAGC